MMASQRMLCDLYTQLTQSQPLSTDSYVRVSRSAFVQSPKNDHENANALRSAGKSKNSFKTLAEQTREKGIRKDTISPLYNDIHSRTQESYERG